MSERPQRADARRNLDALLEAAKDVFASEGVDAPAKDVAERAGVGVGTLYRHFPKRSDLVVAVFRHEVDACAAEAPALSASLPPVEALSQWLLRFTSFVGTKRGLAPALHSGDPAFDELPAYFVSRFGPVLTSLLAEAAGEIRADVSAKDLLHAVANLCHAAPDSDPDYSRRMVAVLVDGLRVVQSSR